MKQKNHENGNERSRTAHGTRRSLLSLTGLIALLLTLSVCFCGCSELIVSLLESHSSTGSPYSESQNGVVTQEPSAGTISNTNVHRSDAENVIERTSGTVDSTEETDNFGIYAISDVVRIVQDSVVQIYTSKSSGAGAGSGVIISAEEGYILTCNHVVEGATAITVELSSMNRYAATLVGTDISTDLAIVKIVPSESEPLVAAKHGISANLVVGEYVVAIGNPLGTLGGSVTHGIISATARQIPFSNSDGTTSTMTLLQTDAPINSGNSGGGLFNLKGELVGIVNAKYADTGVEGLGFAIPIDSAYQVELDLIKYGYVRGIADDGLSFLTVTADNLRTYYYYYGISEAGLYVVSSKYNSEIVNGDRILSVNGITVNSATEYSAAIAGCSIGDILTITYVHSTYSNSVFGGRQKISSETRETTIALREYVPDGISVAFE